MKALLVGIALGVALATQAFALPYCPNHRHHYVCTEYEQ
jgi:hypothetical protein